jgi:hypothetical protein
VRKYYITYVYKPFISNLTNLRYKVVTNHRQWNSISKLIQNTQTRYPAQAPHLLLIVIDLNDCHATGPETDLFMWFTYNKG